MSDKELELLTTTRALIKRVERGFVKAHKSMKYTEAERKIISECIMIVKKLNKFDTIIDKRKTRNQLHKKEQQEARALKKALEIKLRQTKVKVTKKKKVGNKRKSKSVWTVSGGLPGLGKRR